MPSLGVHHLIIDAWDDPRLSGLVDIHRRSHEGKKNGVRARVKKDSEPVELPNLRLPHSPRDSGNATGEVHRANDYQGKERQKADDVSSARISIGRGGSDSQPRTQYRQTDEDPPTIPRMIDNRFTF